MLKKIQTYIEELKMISKGDRIVIGVSGGADSVCLFHVLITLAPKYNLALSALHVNHGIRGPEAEEDEAFVKELCDKNQISFVSVKANVPDIAKKEGLSEEEAGRKIRYLVLYDYLEKNKCNKIAIAHNKKDNAETILFHLFRGTGIQGLTGIRPMREAIIRPLLCVDRHEIESYLKQKDIPYRTDSSNLTDDYSRNKIRHHVIDFAQEEINRKAVTNIVNAAKQLEEINQYLEKTIMSAYERLVSYKEEKDTYAITIESLKQEDVVIQKGIIRLIFSRLAKRLKDLEAKHVSYVLSLQEKEVGKTLHLPYGIHAVRGYHDITMCIGKIKEEEVTHTSTVDFKIPIPGDFYLPQLQSILHTRLINYKKSLIIPQNGCTKWFDYDKIENTVLVRNRKQGDFIQIDSKGSRKKIKSLFIDDKVPREKRDSFLLLADGSHIMWVIGDRMSEAYKVNEQTKVILEISLDGGNEDARQY